MHVFVWDVSFFSTFASRFSFVIFLVGFLIFFLSSSWLSSLRNYTSNHVSRSFFLRFLFHCRYSKCMCSSMKWLVQLPWNIVSAKVFFFVDSNAFRRNIKQVMSMNSKNHSINNRKKMVGESDDWSLSRLLCNTFWCKMTHIFKPFSKILNCHQLFSSALESQLSRSAQCQQKLEMCASSQATFQM